MKGVINMDKEKTSPREIAFDKLFEDEADLDKVLKFQDKFIGTVSNIDDEVDSYLDAVDLEYNNNFPYKNEEENLKYYLNIKNSQDFVNEFADDKTARNYINKNVLEQFDKKFKELSKEDEEIKKREEKKKLNKNQELSDKKNYNKKLSKSKINYDIQVAKDKIKNEFDGLKQYVLDDFCKNFFLKREKWILNEIDKRRKKFLKELFEKMESFEKLFQELQSFTNDTGRLWDMSRGAWSRVDFSLLKEYQKLLDKDKSLKELGELLGKYRKAEIEYEKEIVYEDKEIKSQIYKPAKYGKIEGIKYGRQIPDLIPSCLGYFNNKLTKALFYKDLINEQLMEYNKKSRKMKTLNIKEKIERKKKIEKDNGPFILVIDSSGSMQGTPERIAKIIAFILAKSAFISKRKVFLINFSTEIECTEIGGITGDIKELLNFLSMSFYGGTDINPAFDKALEILESKDYKKADLLLISDGLFPNANSKNKEKIKEFQRKNNKFHSLMIGNSSNSSALEIFDNNWKYNDGDGFKDLVRQMHLIKK